MSSLQISFPGIERGDGEGESGGRTEVSNTYGPRGPTRSSCLPLRPYLLPSAPHLPYFHHTDIFFFQFFKYMQLAPASGLLPLLFPLPGRLSSSSSPHSTEVLGQMSPPGTIQSPTQLCPHLLPSRSFCCIALPFLHHSLFY